MKRNFTKIVAFVLAMITLLALAPMMAVNAAPPKMVKIGKEPWEIAICKFPAGSVSTGNYHWYSQSNPTEHPGDVPVIGDSIFVFCLDQELASASGMQATENPNPLTWFDDTTRCGVQYILENGLRNDENGKPLHPSNLTWQQAYVATQSALRYWLGYRGVINSNPPEYFSQQTAVPGQETAFNYSRWLFDEAVKYADNPPILAVTLSPMNFIESGGYYRATVAVDKQSCESWMVVNDNLPSGSTISPQSGTTNGNITVSIPVSQMTESKTYAIQVVGLSEKSPTNLMWYGPYDPVNQRTVGYIQKMSNGSDTTTTGKTPPSYGSLKIVKSSEDGVVAGISFRVTGEGMDTTVTTGANGEIDISNLKAGTYTVTETVPARYAAQQSQTVTVVAKGTTAVRFVNALKKFRVTVTKQDGETTTAQGSAKLGGAVYGLYKDGTLQDTYTTDASGKFTTAYNICGNGWTLKEITPSEGYLLDPTVHSIGSEATLYTVERNTTTKTVTEKIIKGCVAIIKHTDDGSTQIETPEVGATFELYLTSAGSYDAAKSTERDMLVCDENGYAVSKDLPYGVYTIHQRSGWPGAEKIQDFTVFINENGKVYQYLINNAPFFAKIKIEKRDVETGELITASGIGFQLKDPNGNIITQHIEYPTPTAIDTFYTNDQGWLMLPQPLAISHGYQLIEVQGPWGYVLDSEPVLFDVDGTETTITVVKNNSPQMGQIHVTKQGEVFSSVTEQDGVYQPVYETQGLADTVLDVIALEDIILNGDLKAAEGTVVDTLMTTKDGATSKPLYLGCYKIVERIAPHGMVLSGEEVTVELAYAEQTVEIVTSAASITNQRQKAVLQLTKQMEQDTEFVIGNNGEILAVSFGLFAAENMVAADGSIIPQDGLLETAWANAQEQIAFLTDLPASSKAYVRELTTDGQYQLSTEQYPVNFEYAGQNTAVVRIAVNNGKPIANNILRGGLRIIKTFEGKTTPVSGVPFTITGETVAGKKVTIEVVTDQNGEIIIEGLPSGEYKVLELGSDLTTGYVLSDEETAVIIPDEIAEMRIHNYLIQGAVRLRKVDAATGAPLPGAEFALTTPAGNDLGIFTTDDKGEICVEGLLYGVGYKWVEVKAPVGYLLNATEIYFDITASGVTIELTATNEQIPTIPDNPHTGDNAMWPYLVVLCVAAAGATAMLVTTRRKNKAKKGE